MTAQDRRRFALALAFLLVPALGACNRDAQVEEDTTAEPADEQATGQSVRVTDVELGSSVGPDGKVNDNATTDEFRPTDTIYASVNTEGNATGAALVARWTYQDGQVVDETSRTISGSGPATTEFHISKPDGFPVGKYRIEIRLNGQTTETKEFEVK